MCHCVSVKSFFLPGNVQKHAGLVHIRELERQNAERELGRVRRDLVKQDDLITALQHARDRSDHSA